MLCCWRNTMKTNKLSKSILIAGLLSVVALPVAAKDYHNGYKNNHSSVSYDYARVVGVEPVYQTYQVNHPVEQCYQERVPVRQKYSRHNKRNASYTNEILGGVIGAAVGNQVGKHGGGKARDVVTVVGAVLGASVAHDIERNNNRRSSNGHYQKTRYETVEHCELKDSYTTKRELVGYDVAYKYNGNVYHTQSGQHPGKKIKIKVAVKPV